MNGQGKIAAALNAPAEPVAYLYRDAEVIRFLPEKISISALP